MAEQIIRPRNFTDTATDSDLQNADNYLWLDTANKAKKMEITRLAKVSDITALSRKVSRGRILEGKKWYACGDSYTAGVNANGVISSGGPYNGYKAVYPYFIGDRTGMDVHNIAVAGSTMTCYSESTSENCFSYPETGLYLSIPSDADYITLKFGINDYYQSLPIGGIDDETNATLYGAWNVVMARIRDACPRAKVGIIVPNRAAQGYSKVARDIAVKWGVPFLDENFDRNVPLLNDVTGKPYVVADVKTKINLTFRISSSNIHPNDFAQEYESTIVENFLLSL